MAKELDKGLRLFLEITITALLEKYGMDRNELCDLILRCSEEAQALNAILIEKRKE